MLLKPLVEEDVRKILFVAENCLANGLVVPKSRQKWAELVCLANRSSYLDGLQATATPAAGLLSAFIASEDYLRVCLTESSLTKRLDVLYCICLFTDEWLVE